MRRSHLTWGGVAIIAAPAVIGIGYSFAGATGWTAGAAAGDEGAARITRVATEAGTWAATLWTLWISIAATSIATALAVAVAAAFRGSRRTDRIVQISSTLPFAVPHVVAGLLGLLILGQSGMLARFAHAMGLIDGPDQMPALVYDRFGFGLIASLAWKEFAFLVLVAWSILTERGDRLEETARTLGASAFRAFTGITLPVLARAMLPAIVAVFTFVLGSYEAAALLAPSDPLPLAVLTMERYHDADLAARGDAYVLALVGFALASVAVVIHEKARMNWGRFQ